MAKKKLSLKPVIRGVATTSVAPKKHITPLGEEPDVPSDGTPPDPSEIKVTEAGGPSEPPEREVEGGIKDDWEDEKLGEGNLFQALVERLHDKGEKEVARIVKTVEYDKRLALSFPRLEINRDIRDRVLELALEEEDTLGERTAVPLPGSQSERDKALLRSFVAWHVLLQLGFREERVEECFTRGVGGDDGWEEALQWMWLHLSEDECLARGEYAKRQEISLKPPDDPLLPEAMAPPSPKATNTPSQSASRSQSTVPSSPTQTSLFQSLGSSPASESDSDGEPDLNKVNETWAQLMLELDGLRTTAGASKSKGKKNKGAVVIIETPDMRRLKDRIAKLEKEYLFNRRDADILFRSSKARRNAEALEARLRGPSSINAEAPDDDGPEDVNAAQGSIQEGGLEDDAEMFGNMLDEPIASGEPMIDDSSGPAITIRSMPIPRQFAFAGNVPKTLLKAGLVKSAKQAVITYAKLSGHSRAARAGLEIRWSADRRRVWRMEDIACEEMSEADNYVSIIALNELTASGDLSGINWRTLPPAYKDLWAELEVARSKSTDEGKRTMWRKISHVLERKANGESPWRGNDIAAGNDPSTENPNSGGLKAPQNIYSERLQNDFERRKSSSAYQTMLRYRNNLPIASFRQQIIDTLHASQIIVLSGETGCGKSTQLPSFILEDHLARGQPCKIFVTEPRRISAISLAQRVSQELGDAQGAMGTNASLVGYSIRLEAKVSPSTRLAFVTNGIALRMLEGGSGPNNKSTAFDEVTHIIVDEVHERSIESDFLLIVLKSLIQQRPDLKVVLMSATLDAEKLSNFFGGCPYLAVPGRIFPVQVNYLEDAVEAAGWAIDETSQYAIRPRRMKASSKQLEWSEENAKPEDDEDSDDESDPTKLSSARYSAETVSTVNLLDSRQIPYELIIRLLERLCFEDSGLQAFSAATLVFLPGLAEIRKLNDILAGHPAFGSADFVIYPLHSTISSEGQSQVFEMPPAGVRKIVISTNIAETGVTIPDIACVIDSGKHREMRYDEKRQLSRLVETYIARSNAKQRRGRAGRVREGIAFHLFTKARHDTQLAEHPVPEMLRLSLQDLALRIKILRIKLGTSVEEVLLKALDPPTSTNIQRAIAALIEVKALTPTEEISPMGRLLSKLPMDVHLGKFLLIAALFRCLDPALTIAATLNSKSPFVTPFGFETQADAAKRSFAVGNSDFLTIVNVFNSWRRASDNSRFVRTFCTRNFVSQQNLQQIEELRQQLFAYLLDSGFVEASPVHRQEISQARFSRGVRTSFVTLPAELNINGDNVQMLSAALAAGLYPKLLNLDSSEGMKTISNQQPVAIHPSSINFRVHKSEFGTNYLTYFTIMQSKKLYAWETGPVDDRSLALLCGDQADFKLSVSSLQIDRRLRYKIDAKSALAIKLLREQMAHAMSARMRGKPLSDSQARWLDLGLKCVMTGRRDGDEPSVGVI